MYHWRCLLLVRKYDFKLWLSCVKVQDRLGIPIEWMLRLVVLIVLFMGNINCSCCHAMKLNKHGMIVVMMGLRRHKIAAVNKCKKLSSSSRAFTNKFTCRVGSSKSSFRVACGHAVTFLSDHRLGDETDN